MEKSNKPTDVSEIFENANLPKIRTVIRCFCVLCIIFWLLYHVTVSYGLYGLIIFIFLFLLTCYLAEENVSHVRLVFGQRVLIVAGTIGIMLHYGGLYMVPIAILQIALLITIEFLYKAVEELKERMERVECDVSYLFDENAADEYGEEEEQVQRVPQQVASQGITRNLKKK